MDGNLILYIKVFCATFCAKGAAFVPIVRMQKQGSLFHWLYEGFRLLLVEFENKTASSYPNAYLQRK